MWNLSYFSVILVRTKANEMNLTMFFVVWHVVIFTRDSRALCCIAWFMIHHSSMWIGFGERENSWLCDRIHTTHSQQNSASNETVSQQLGNCIDLIEKITKIE